MDNTIQEFSLALPPWFVSNYIVLCKYGRRKIWGGRAFLFSFHISFLYFGGVFNETKYSPKLSRVFL